MSDGRFIVVSGSIGVGKSTLVEALARGLSIEAHLERPEANPYFNRDPLFTFHAEVCFLTESLEATQLSSTRCGGVQERSVEEQVAVFARIHRLNGRLDDNELVLLERLLEASATSVARPDYLLYLHARPSTLLGRIRKRGRPGEESVDLAYLTQLHELYEAFIGEWDASPILRIDTDMIDFRDAETIRTILQRVRREQ